MVRSQPPDDGLLTAEDVAARLNLSAHAVRSAAYRGEIPCVRLGKRKVRFEPGAVERFVESRRGDKPAERLDAARRLRNGMLALLDEHELPAAFVDAVGMLLREAQCEGQEELAVGEQGELYWTPRGLAHALGLVQLYGSEESAVARLMAWRRAKQGPPFIKIGATQQAPIFYEVHAARRWFESQRAECGPLEGMDALALRQTARVGRHTSGRSSASVGARV